jgi:hypothetical protein
MSLVDPKRKSPPIDCAVRRNYNLLHCMLWKQLPEMVEERAKRHLAAKIAADVVG